jgi:hypothetical protein
MRTAVLLLSLALLGCRAATTPCVPTPLATDDFDRPDQVGLGVAPSGQPWTVTGPGYQAASIESGRLTAGAPASDNIVYAGLATLATPVRVGGTFSFVAGPGSDVAPIALISSSDASFHLERMVHLIVTPDGWRLTTWNGVAQDVAFQEGPSVETFPRRLATDGTVYAVWMTIDGDRVQLELPLGIVAAYRDPLVPELAGPLSIWELLYSAASADVPRWESVAAMGSSCS